MNAESKHELDWLAFQYVADELTAEDRAAFESRLEDEQAAREAVARAVELCIATDAAYQEDAVVVAARDRLFGKSSRGWWSVAVAACALFALVAVSKFTRDAGERLAAPSTPADQLAMAWSETRVALPTSAISLPDEYTAEFTAFDEDLELRGGNADDDETLVALPTWIVAAVADVEMDNGMDMTTPEQVEKSPTIE